MSKFVDFDADRGVETWEDMNDGHLQLHYKQDCSPVLDYTKALRNDGLTDHGIKNDLWHYAQIPPVIILEMKFKHGVDCFKKDHMKRVFELINREYPYLKTTEKNHWLRH
jgi:hypothetical protein